MKRVESYGSNLPRVMAFVIMIIAVSVMLVVPELAFAQGADPTAGFKSKMSNVETSLVVVILSLCGVMFLGFLGWGAVQGEIPKGRLLVILGVAAVAGGWAAFRTLVVG